MATSQNDGPPLLARQRQEKILQWVDQHGAVRISDIVGTLGISEMTARRDISELVDRGLVDRVHGGAVALEPAALEPSFESKSIQLIAEKARIAAQAVPRVRPGESVALTAGTTTLAVAKALTRLPHFSTLTLVTNSLPAAQVLYDATQRLRAEGKTGATVMLSGGERTPSDALVGLLAVETFERLRLEWVFAGAHGYDPQVGLMTPNMAEASTNVAMIEASRSVVAVLDHTKWAVAGLRSFCHPSRIGVIVTDEEPDAQTCESLSNYGVTLEVAHDGS
ncbi:MAG: DeoR/GlpR family DNA-binding transcription regulator [Bowdeniella nasicola]|nr:DeoR/GlpR family DNA-binding transcription regulator [Bowdeniella nasicola]